MHQRLPTRRPPISIGWASGEPASADNAASSSGSGAVRVAKWFRRSAAVRNRAIRGNLGVVADITGWILSGATAAVHVAGVALPCPESCHDR